MASRFRMQSLGSLAFVAAGVAILACSSDPVATPSTQNDASAGVDASVGADSSVPSDAAVRPDAPVGTCPAPIGVFAETEYYHPMHKLTRGSCTAADLQTLDKIGLGSYAARRSLVSASCNACVYSDQADAEWGLLIVVDSDTAITNYAGCAITAGDTRACVKQNSAWRLCTRKACASCPAAVSSNCAQTESESGQCKPYYEADAACGGVWPTGCNSSGEMIQKYCGP